MKHVVGLFIAQPITFLKSCAILSRRSWTLLESFATSKHRQIDQLLCDFCFYGISSLHNDRDENSSEFHFLAERETDLIKTKFKWFWFCFIGSQVENLDGFSSAWLYCLSLLTILDIQMTWDWNGFMVQQISTTKINLCALLLFFFCWNVVLNFTFRWTYFIIHNHKRRKFAKQWKFLN